VHFGRKQKIDLETSPTVSEKSEKRNFGTVPMKGGTKSKRSFILGQKI
jgi:hypothetical protein